MSRLPTSSSIRSRWPGGARHCSTRSPAQDHRRGGHLLAHRPVRLPGQRRRFAGRDRVAASDPRRPQPGTRRPHRPAFRRPRCRTRTVPPPGRRVRLLRDGDRAAASGAVPEDRCVVRRSEPGAGCRRRTVTPGTTTSRTTPAGPNRVQDCPRRRLFRAVGAGAVLAGAGAAVGRLSAPEAGIDDLRSGALPGYPSGRNRHGRTGSHALRRVRRHQPTRVTNWWRC